MRPPLANAVAVAVARQPAAAATVPIAATPFIRAAPIVIGVRVVIACEKRLGICALVRVLAWIAGTSGIDGRVPTRVAITSYVAGAAAGVGDRHPAVSGNRDVRHVGHVAAVDAHTPLGIADADRVADVASAVDIANEHRAALGTRRRDAPAASTCGACGAAEAADA